MVQSEALQARQVLQQSQIVIGDVVVEAEIDGVGLFSTFSELAADLALESFNHLRRPVNSRLRLTEPRREGNQEQSQPGRQLRFHHVAPRLSWSAFSIIAYYSGQCGRDLSACPGRNKSTVS